MMMIIINIWDLVSIMIMITINIWDLWDNIQVIISLAKALHNMIEPNSVANKYVLYCDYPK